MAMVEPLGLLDERPHAEMPNPLFREDARDR